MLNHHYSYHLCGNLLIFFQSEHLLIFFGQNFGQMESLIFSVFINVLYFIIDTRLT